MKRRELVLVLAIAIVCSLFTAVLVGSVQRPGGESVIPEEEIQIVHRDRVVGGIGS